MSEDETEAELAWSSIEAGHGIVAVDVDWAQAQGLPQTAAYGYGEKPGKVIYGIEAYHAIHCLVNKAYHNSLML